MDIFAPPAHEYDKYSYDDRTDLMGFIPALLSQYGPYLVSRKREAIRRRQREDLFDDRSLWCFLNLVGTRKFAGQEEKKLGWFAHELTGGTPLDPNDDATVIQENLSKQEPPDAYDDIEYRKRNKLYYPDPEHPLGVQEQTPLSNDSKILRDIQKTLKNDPNSEFKSIEEYRQNALKHWTESSQDKTPELLDARLKQGQSAVLIAKELIEQARKKAIEEHQQQLLKDPSATMKPVPTLEERQKQYNNLLKSDRFKSNQKGYEKSYDLEEYATKMVNDTISNLKLSREGAKQGLDKLKELGAKPSKPIELAKLVLPSRVKNRMIHFFNNNKGPEKETLESIQEQSKSQKAEDLGKQLADGKTPTEVAKSIFVSKGMPPEKALEELDKKMKLYNRKTEKYNLNVPEDKKKTLYDSLDAYAKHYVDEVIRLETYYKQVAQKRLDEINKGQKGAIDFPRFSSAFEKMMKISHRLSSLAQRQVGMGRYGHSPDFLRLVDIVADNGIRELNG
jgi:hypothetical protein